MAIASIEKSTQGLIEMLQVKMARLDELTEACQVERIQAKIDEYRLGCRMLVERIEGMKPMYLRDLEEELDDETVAHDLGQNGGYDNDEQWD